MIGYKILNSSDSKKLRSKILKFKLFNHHSIIILFMVFSVFNIQLLCANAATGMDSKTKLDEGQSKPKTFRSAFISPRITVLTPKQIACLDEDKSKPKPFRSVAGSSKVNILTATQTACLIKECLPVQDVVETETEKFTQYFRQALSKYPFKDKKRNLSFTAKNWLSNSLIEEIKTCDALVISGLVNLFIYHLSHDLELEKKGRAFDLKDVLESGIEKYFIDYISSLTISFEQLKEQLIISATSFAEELIDNKPVDSLAFIKLNDRLLNIYDQIKAPNPIESLTAIITTAQNENIGKIVSTLLEKNPGMDTRFKPLVFNQNFTLYDISLLTEIFNYFFTPTEIMDLTKTCYSFDLNSQFLDLKNTLQSDRVHLKQAIEAQATHEKIKSLTNCLLAHFLAPYRLCQYTSIESYMSLVAILQMINTDQAINMANLLLYCLSHEGPQGTLSISVSDNIHPFYSMQLESDSNETYYRILKQVQGARCREELMTDKRNYNLLGDPDEIAAHIIQIIKDNDQTALNESIALSKCLKLDMSINPSALLTDKETMIKVLVQFFEKAETLDQKKLKIETLAKVLGKMKFTVIANTLIALLEKHDGINRDHLMQPYQFNYLSTALYTHYESLTTQERFVLKQQDSVASDDHTDEYLDKLAHGQVVLFGTIKTLENIIGKDWVVWEDEKVDCFKMFSAASREEVERQMIRFKLIADPNSTDITPLNTVNIIHDLVSFVLLTKSRDFEKIDFLKVLITYLQKTNVQLANKLAGYLGFVDMLPDPLPAE